MNDDIVDLARAIIGVIKDRENSDSLLDYYQITNFIMIHISEAIINLLEGRGDIDELNRMFVTTFRGYTQYTKLYGNMLNIVRFSDLTMTERAKLTFIMQKQVNQDQADPEDLAGKLMDEIDELKDKVWEQSLLLDMYGREEKYEVLVAENKRLARELKQFKLKQANRSNIVQGLFTNDDY
jgi:hypothetical protein